MPPVTPSKIFATPEFCPLNPNSTSRSASGPPRESSAGRRTSRGVAWTSAVGIEEEVDGVGEVEVLLAASRRAGRLVDVEISVTLDELGRPTLWQRRRLGDRLSPGVVEA